MIAHSQRNLPRIEPGLILSGLQKVAYCGRG